MKAKFLILLLLVTFYQGYPQSSLFKIDPRNFVENKITLSEIADDIIYISLDNKIPIGITNTLRITDKNIYLSIKDVGILKFDKSGKLVCTIGSKGRGPGEYSYGFDFTVDEKSGNVFVLDPGKVKVYSQNGLFLRDILYEKYVEYIGGDIEIYNSILFIPDYVSYGNSKYCWLFLDTLGNTVAKKENSIPTFQTNIGSEGSIYRFENKIFYFNVFNDTIFSISSDLSYSSAYLFAKGDHRYPRTRIATNPQSQFITQWHKLFKLMKMFETKHFIVLLYSYLDKTAICLIDKETKKTYLAFKYNETSGSDGADPYLINNLDGGMPLNEGINYYVENGKEYIAQLIDPFHLNTFVSSDEFKKMIPKYPEKKKELEKLANSLKETDNPVLMMVKLKK